MMRLHLRHDGKGRQARTPWPNCSTGLSPSCQMDVKHRSVHLATEWCGSRLHSSSAAKFTGGGDVNTFRWFPAAVVLAMVLALIACSEEESGAGAAVPELPVPSISHRDIPSPSLPISVSSDIQGEDRTCVTVAWLGAPDLLDGVTVTVTSVRLEPAGRAAINGACAGLPGCPSFTYWSEYGRCSLSLWWTVHREAQLSLLGELNCAPANEQTCTDLMTKLRSAGTTAPVTPPEAVQSTECSKSEEHATSPSATSVTPSSTG